MNKGFAKKSCLCLESRRHEVLGRLAGLITGRGGPVWEFCFNFWDELGLVVISLKGPTWDHVARQSVKSDPWVGEIAVARANATKKTN